MTKAIKVLILLESEYVADFSKLPLFDHFRSKKGKYECKRCNEVCESAKHAVKHLKDKHNIKLEDTSMMGSGGYTSIAPVGADPGINVLRV